MSSMKGFLSFLILWMISRKKMTGNEIANELKSRKGSKPSPGTIYPALKELRQKGLIQSDKEKRYTLTKKGQEELQAELETFFSIFCDLSEMRSCCKH